VLSFTFALLFAFLVGLAAASGLRLRARLTRWRAKSSPLVDDEAVRRIVEEGVFEAVEAEPLDLDEIADEERRFWSELWDEPEEW